MFNNIGKKIKALAKIVFGILTALFEIGGIILFALGAGYGYGPFILIGLLIMIIGPLFAWLSTLQLYGFGEIIDKLTDVESNIRGNASKPDFVGDRLEKIEKLHNDGIISDEEYNKAISNL